MGVPKIRSRWAAHTRIAIVREYPPPPRHDHSNESWLAVLWYWLLFCTRWFSLFPFESVDEILKCEHANESYWALLSFCTVCFSWKLKFRVFFFLVLYLGTTRSGWVNWERERIIVWCVSDIIAGYNRASIYRASVNKLYSREGAREYLKTFQYNLLNLRNDRCFACQR